MNYSSLIVAPIYVIVYIIYNGTLKIDNYLEEVFPGPAIFFQAAPSLVRLAARSVTKINI